MKYKLSMDFFNEPPSDEDLNSTLEHVLEQVRHGYSAGEVIYGDDQEGRGWWDLTQETQS